MSSEKPQILMKDHNRYLNIIASICCFNCGFKYFANSLTSHGHQANHIGAWQPSPVQKGRVSFSRLSLHRTNLKSGQIYPSGQLLCPSGALPSPSFLSVCIQEEEATRTRFSWKQDLDLASKRILLVCFVEVV